MIRRPARPCAGVPLLLLLVGLLAGGCAGEGPGSFLTGRNLFGRKRRLVNERPVDLTGRGTIGLSARMVRRPSWMEELGQLGLGKRPVCVVTHVHQGGPAAAAGLQVGDWLLRAGTTRLLDAEAIIDLVRHSRPGSTLSLTVRRAEDGRSETVDVTVGRLPENEQRLRLGVDDA